VYNDTSKLIYLNTVHEKVLTARELTASTPTVL